MEILKIEVPLGDLQARTTAETLRDLADRIDRKGVPVEPTLWKDFTGEFSASMEVVTAEDGSWR